MILVLCQPKNTASCNIEHREDSVRFMEVITDTVHSEILYVCT